MNLSSYISDIKTYLTDLGQNPAPVLDGPYDFALANQYEKSFISVHETEMPVTIHDDPLVYSKDINLVFQIHVEKATSDSVFKHLDRARQLYDDVFTAIGTMKISGFQVIRQGGRRLPTDSPTRALYEIDATLHIKLAESCG